MKRIMIWAGIAYAVLATVIITIIYNRISQQSDKKCFVTQFQHDGHSYLRFKEFRDSRYDFCVVHNPNCDCVKRVSNSRPVQHSSYVESGIYSGTAKKNVK